VKRGPGPNRARALGQASALIFLAALCGCEAKVGEKTDCPPAEKAKSVSGFCVPRWVVLKRGDVNAHQGPGPDYPVVWAYHAKGLPVQVVAETEDWRRICDPDGNAAWIKRIMIDGKRNVMVLGTGALPIRKGPDAASPSVGEINARSLAGLDGCQGDWCKVKIQGVKGWLPAASLWGTATGRVCK
jgi:SH3-like domain-containing protein